jgi:hypothetical protein
VAETAVPWEANKISAQEHGGRTQKRTGGMEIGQSDKKGGRRYLDAGATQVHKLVYSECRSICPYK